MTSTPEGEFPWAKAWGRSLLLRSLDDGAWRWS